MAQIVKSPAMRQAEGIIALAGDSGALKAELDRLETSRAAIAEEMSALHALKQEVTGTQEQIASHTTALAADRKQLEDDQVRHREMADNLERRLTEMQEQSRDLDAREAAVGKAEQAVREEKGRAERMNTEAAETKRQAEAMKEAMQARVDAVLAAWGN